jgi:DNA polymerase-3 subunit gamma/tau
MSLYLKYRPTSLEAVKGNEELVASLDAMLNNKKTCPHSFLLTGPTGCGKTTIGRIIAERLGSKGSDCREIDSADFRGIDTIRDIRKNSQYMAMESECRVWILDEIHRATPDALSALLKILEDTPSHVYFVLCTTDPQKLLPTLKGRCSTFVVKPLEDEMMKRLLKRIVRQEEGQIDDQILEQIVSSAQGHPRNALQILDQVLRVDPEQQLEIAKHGAEVTAQIIDLCRILTSSKTRWKEIAAILTALKVGEDPESIRRVILGYCQAILLKGAENNSVAAVMEAFMEPTYNTGFPGIVFACYSATH